MNMKRIAALLLAQVTLGLVLSIAVFAQGPLAPTASEIDQGVTAALRDLYGQNEAAKALGAKAKAVLVFPDIKKAAFIVGAQHGYGALRQGPTLYGTMKIKAQLGAPRRLRPIEIQRYRHLRAVARRLGLRSLFNRPLLTAFTKVS
jgi:hypothetical protein